MWEQDPQAMKAAMVPLEDTLIEMLKQKQVLLSSTTANTCWGSAQLVSRIERMCPGVVLATSREGMAIDGEQLLALPGPPRTTGLRWPPSYAAQPMPGYTAQAPHRKRPGGRRSRLANRVRTSF